VEPEEVDQAKAQGFRNPPDHITYACLGYIARVMELRDFISLFFGLIKSSQAIAQTMTPESAPHFLAEANKYKVEPYSFSTHRQFVNELMLSRAVETFDLYVLTVMRHIFEARPEILKSEGPIETATVIDLKTFDDIVFFLAERKLHELSFKPLSELRKYIKTRTGLDLFGSDEAYDDVLLASEVRNLIAHSDCRVNEIFRKRIKDMPRPADIEIPEEGKIALSDDWIRRISYRLDGLAFNFDEAAVSKFSLPTMNRMTSFIFRG
jgi:hypothetical protein